MSKDKWFADLWQMPIQNNNPIGYTEHIHSTEKAAILHARQLRVAEVDRLTAEIKQLDERYDQIETAEVIAEAVTEDYMPQVKL